MASSQSLVDLIGTSNLDEPKPIWNYSEFIIGITIASISISWVCVVARIYTRLCIVKSPGWDDALIVMYIITGTIGAIAVCIAPSYGMGQHFALLSLEEIHTYLKTFYTANATYMMQTGLVKMSLLFQYLRVYKPGVFRTTCVATLVITSLWCFAFSFMCWFPCFPPSNYWNFVDSYCYAFGSLRADIFFDSFVTSTTSNFVLDVVVLALAVPIYFQDDGPKTRFGPAALLLLGIMINVFSIARLVTIINHKAATDPIFDPTWYGPTSIILAVLEVNVASVCACVPVFWPILSDRFNDIIVTREIKITRSPRQYSPDPDDEIELHRSLSGENGQGSMHSRAGSDSSQVRLGGLQQVRSAEKDHYKDSFVRDQVDPLRPKRSLVITSEAVALQPPRKQSRT